MKALLWVAVGVIAGHLLAMSPLPSAAGRAMGAQASMYATPIAAPVGR